MIDKKRGDEMNITERVEALRKKMLGRGIEAYIVPTSDPHQSEYVADYYKTREYITGFTGSAGTAVITQKECGLWTDGRYFLQAEEELKGSPFQLYRLGTDDLSVEDFIIKHVSSFGKVGFDGKCMATSSYRKLSKELGKRMLISNIDYVGDIWEDRPALPSQSAYFYPKEYSGRTVEEKLSILRYMMRDRDVDYTFIGALEDICYLYNIRGWDVESTPVVLSYALVSRDQAYLFIDGNKVTSEVKEPLEEAGIRLYDYEAVETFLREIEGQKVVYLDPNRTNIYLYDQLGNNVKIQTGINLTSYMKAIKTDIEIANTKEAHIKDGVAVVKFFRWLETGARTSYVSEASAAEKLHEFRQNQEDFLQDSFAAIVGYGPNGAIVHYNPLTVQRSARVEARGLLLVDSGGQYLQGTTDVTRTYAMGETTYEEKLDYTLVLKAHIAGMTARFPTGTTGKAIHEVTRYPLLKELRDYNHGTGHGVGHLLGVHEGPQSFSKNDQGVEIATGMITSVEPGLYVAGKYGIRTESLTLCVDCETNDFGHFLEFEPITWVPIDTRPILRQKLEDWEVEWLNHYNQTCFDKLSAHMEGEDLAYLEARCQAIG